MLGTRLCAAAYQQADALVLGKLMGDVTLGYFSMAKQLALLPVEKVSAVVNQIAYPVMADLQGSCDAMRNVFLRGFRLVVCISVPMCVGLALVAEDLVWVTLTEKWLAAVPLLQMLCLYALIRSIDVLLPPVLIARYRSLFLFGYAMVMLVVMPIAFWAGAASMGAMGVALTWVTVYPVIMVWLAREALKELGLGWRLLWEQVSPSMLATLLMAAVVLAVQWAMPGFNIMDRVVRLALAIGTGVLAYGLGIFCWGGLVTGELREIIGSCIRTFRPSFARDKV